MVREYFYVLSPEFNEFLIILREDTQFVAVLFNKELNKASDLFGWSIRIPNGFLQSTIRNLRH